VSHITRFRLAVTCTASNATVSQYVEGGFLHAWAFTPATASAFATGATCSIDFCSDITSGGTQFATHNGIVFTNTSAVFVGYPRIKPQTTAGATAADLTNGQRIPLAREFIRVQVASGGASGVGIFDFWIEGR